MSHEHRPGSAECLELLGRLSEYLDGELDAGACSELEGHMEDCPPCKAFLESLRRTVRLVETQPAAAAPGEVREEVRKALEELKGAGGS